MDELACTLALKKIKGFKDCDIHNLLIRFRNPCNVFGASRPDLLKAGLKDELVGLLSSERTVRTAFFEAINEIEEASRNGIKIITSSSSLYPLNLGFVKNKPAVLYYKGALRENLKFAVAIAGQRNPPAYSVNFTKDLTDKLCGAGFSIISGLARGIDTEAHKSALRNGCYTLAYIGSGLLAPVYPRENVELYQEIILKEGAVVSELPLYTQLSPVNLVARDRLQSGTGLGVIAVSSGLRSGTLKTCNFALKQKRPVFIPVYKKELMDSPDNKGLKSLLGRPGVIGLKLKNGMDLESDMEVIIDFLKISYNTLYELKPDVNGSILRQPDLF